MDDHYTDIQYRDSAGNWQQWPHSWCEDNGGSVLANFQVNTTSPHEYYTADGSGDC